VFLPPSTSLASDSFVDLTSCCLFAEHGHYGRYPQVPQVPILQITVISTYDQASPTSALPASSTNMHSTHIFIVLSILT